MGACLWYIVYTVSRPQARLCLLASDNLPAKRCSLVGSQDYIHAVNHQMLSSIRDEFCEEPSLVCPEFRHLAEAILFILNLNSPTTFLQALEVYFVLIVTIENTI